MFVLGEGFVIRLGNQELKGVRRDKGVQRVCYMIYSFNYCEKYYYNIINVIYYFLKL